MTQNTLNSPVNTPQLGSYGSPPPKGGWVGNQSWLPGGTNGEPKGTNRNQASAVIFDLARIKAEANLLAIIEPDVQFTGTTHGPRGLEYYGPCPICGLATRNGFVVQVENNTWFCRKCTGPGNFTAIDYLAVRRGYNREHLTRAQLVEIVEAITGNARAYTTPITQSPAQEPKPAALPPDEQWQTAAIQYTHDAHHTLMGKSGEGARRWLRDVRGITEGSMERFYLGYNPADRWDPPEVWGTPNGSPKKVYLPAGLVIPWVYEGEVWAINTRRKKNPDGTQPEPKYYKVRGSRAAIYNVGDLRGADTVLFTEGELDCIAAWQQVNDVLTVVTFGAAGTLPDLGKFGLFLTGASDFLAAYDNDNAGEIALEKLRAIIPHVTAVPIPAQYKDLGEFHQAGGDLYRLIEPYLPPLTEDDLTRYDPHRWATSTAETVSNR